MKVKQRKTSQRGSFIIPIIIIVVSISICGLAYFYLSKPTKHGAVATSNTAPSEMPVNDYAPNLPMSQKAIIIVRDSDSSTQKIIVPKEQVGTFIKSLPNNQTVVSTSQ